jgi:hypothetical protein
VTLTAADGADSSSEHAWRIAIPQDRRDGERASQASVDWLFSERKRSRMELDKVLIVRLAYCSSGSHPVSCAHQSSSLLTFVCQISTVFLILVVVVTMKPWELTF